ncbi:alpha/beta hydrolase [Paraburkholderia sp. ZP32-5]|uniref:alpha/beta hydrolase n=1 Tax=Paraburkholderia sp. ZP32-5 TaxID=2883245 RepID=UPI001F354344|nr:alpha/beta hydrolase [Paraburkholderia sp. ZP32-5]
MNTPVPRVQSGRLEITTPRGRFEVPIQVSRDWTRPQDDVTRAVVVIPGWPRRDLRSGEHAAALAGAAAQGVIVITPQFLTAKDITAHQLPDDVLRWRENDWPKGRLSGDIASVSSFQIVDAIFAKLANRAIFPKLDTVVLAGHSAGGQFVQRYAAISQGDAGLANARIHVKYVVANPASYLYFTSDRPDSDGAFTPFNSKSCPAFDHWNYGLQDGVPPYDSRSASAGELTARYLQRDIVYLLGAADTDAAADGLDRSCAAEAQGPTRYARGLAFDAYVHLLDPNTKQHVVEAPGIAHSSYRMFSSACGLAVLFGKAGCDAGL